MGPCKFCGEMIYLEWIAERGYHRGCYEKDGNRRLEEEKKLEFSKNCLLKMGKREEKRKISRSRNKKLKSLKSI